MPSHSVWFRVLRTLEMSNGKLQKVDGGRESGLEMRMGWDPECKSAETSAPSIDRRKHQNTMGVVLPGLTEPEETAHIGSLTLRVSTSLSTPAGTLEETARRSTEIPIDYECSPSSPSSEVPSPA